MNKERSSGTDNGKHPEEKVFWIVGLGLVTMAVVPGVFVFVFHSLAWGGPKDWATFATYFSGVATPVVALCSALLFYRSIIVQRDEFDKTRREMQQATELQHKTVLAQERSNELLKLSEELKRQAHVQQQQERSIERYANEKDDLDRGFCKNYPLLSRYNFSLVECIENLEKELLEDIDFKSSKDTTVNYLFNYMRVSIDLCQVMSKYLTNEGDVHIYRHLGQKVIMEKSPINSILEKLEVSDPYIESYSKTVDDFRILDNHFYLKWASGK